MPRTLANLARCDSAEPFRPKNSSSPGPGTIQLRATPIRLRPKITTDLKALVGGLYDLLEPVDSADRHKATKAVMTMLGDRPVSLGEVGGKGDNAGDEDDGGGDSDYSRAARDWMKRYTVSEDNLSHVFHIENGQTEVIAHEVPGSTTKQKTINADRPHRHRSFARDRQCEGRRRDRARPLQEDGLLQ